MGNKSLKTAIIYTLYVLFLVSGLFILATILWILITSYEAEHFFLVLSKILKNAGSYSVLLVGIVITIFFQVYSKEKELEQEDKIKIGEVGYYTLSFPLEDEPYKEEYNGDKLVVEIDTKDDYKFAAEKDNLQHFHFMAKFLTSKENSTNLKNIMAFSETYFENNKTDILENYYKHCEMITYCSPLYCATKPTNRLNPKEKEGRNQYFWLVLKCSDDRKEVIRNFWISAITEEGILLFVKIKACIRVVDKGGETKAQISLLQQTNYFESHNKLCELYK